jgi:hypothetical protein
MLADLEAAHTIDSVAGEPLVVVARSPSESFSRSLRETGFRLIEDSSGDLWGEAGITTTPVAMKVDGTGRVTSKAVTIDVASFASS